MLPVGGIREKVAAAQRCGPARVILPRGSRHQVDLLGDDLRRAVAVDYVTEMTSCWRWCCGAHRRQTPWRRRPRRRPESHQPGAADAGPWCGPAAGRAGGGSIQVADQPLPVRRAQPGVEGDAGGACLSICRYAEVRASRRLEPSRRDQLSRDESCRRRIRVENEKWIDITCLTGFIMLFIALALYGALSSHHGKLRDEIAALRAEIRCFAEQEDCDLARLLSELDRRR